MNAAEYDRLDGLAMAELVRAKEVPPRELVEAALARADQVNPAINAIIHRMDGDARMEAASSDGLGPFAGVPFLVKDLVLLVKGQPFWGGSRFFQGFVPDHDTELMARFRQAGLVTIGKTNTPEFGLTPFTEPTLFGPTKNPWSLDHTAGGSSGGSAAAVAAGIVPLAGGGDGGGSIRIPASCCGLFGLKPTRGRVPTGPDYSQLWQGAVVEHVLTRSVRDSAAALDATHGPDVGAPYAAAPPSRPFRSEVDQLPGRLTIAWTDASPLGGSVHPDCAAAARDAATLLEQLGHTLVEAAPPIDGPAFARAFLTMVCAECAADVSDAGRIMGKKPTRLGFEPTTWALHLLGQALRADELSQALRFLGTTARAIGRFFTQFDLLVTPTLALPPWLTGALQPSRMEQKVLENLGRLGSGRLFQLARLLDQMTATVFAAVPFTAIFNATGQPAMSVPLYWNGQGLPIGTQIVGRFGDEASLFRVAGQLERARPWFDRRPPPVWEST
jgi:amidase